MPQEDLAVGFGRLIDELRNERSIGVNELARTSSMSGPYLSLVLRGKNGPPSVEKVKALAGALEANHFLLLTASGQLDPVVYNLALHLQESIAHNLPEASEKTLQSIAVQLFRIIEKLRDLRVHGSENRALPGESDTACASTRKDGAGDRYQVFLTRPEPAEHLDNDEWVKDLFTKLAGTVSTRNKKE